MIYIYVVIIGNNNKLSIITAFLCFFRPSPYALMRSPLKLISLTHRSDLAVAITFSLHSDRTLYPAVRPKVFACRHSSPHY